MGDMITFLIAFVVTLGSFIMLGGFFLLGGIYLRNEWKENKKKCTIKKYGKIINIVRHDRNNSSNRRTISWHIVFEFNAGDRKFIRESPYGCTKSKFSVGQEIEVYFDSENYNEYYIVGDDRKKEIGTVFIVLGISIIIIAILYQIGLIINKTI